MTAPWRTPSIPHTCCSTSAAIVVDLPDPGAPSTPTWRPEDQPRTSLTIRVEVWPTMISSWPGFAVAIF
jgi:hypothetical protein